MTEIERVTCISRLRKLRPELTQEADFTTQDIRCRYQIQTARILSVRYDLEVTKKRRPKVFGIFFYFYQRGSFINALITRKKRAHVTYVI